MLDGAPRFRDLGGLPTSDGRVVRPGRLYRSESLWRLTDGDLERLRGLAIRQVFDLRGAEERRHQLHRWPVDQPAEFVVLGSETEAQSHHEFMRMVRHDFTPSGAHAALADYYRRFPAAFLDRLPILFERLAAADGVPALILCQFGKDRTGFVVALLLAALGVPLDIIRRDYASTGTRSHPADRARAEVFFAEAIGGPPDPASIAVMMSASVTLLDAALETVAGQFGSLDAYLERCGALDSVRRDRLRRALLA